MTTPTNDIEVVDVPAEDRFVVRGPDAEAELVYRLNGERSCSCTPRYPRRGAATASAAGSSEAALARARAEQLTVVPWCPFARHWLKEHPDEAGAVDVDFETSAPE